MSKSNPQKAVALKYDQNGSNAPIVVASGSGLVAQKIIDVAAKNEIPVYHDDNAAALLSQLDLGAEIPTELYQIVVDIYVELIKTAKSNLNQKNNTLSSLMP